MKKIFITGINSGFGKALKNEFIENGYDIYGISKNIKNETKKIKKADLVNNINLKKKIINLFKNVKNFDYVILNAGILGKIDKVDNINEKNIIQSLNISLFANKIIVDQIIKNQIKVKSIIGISSGASLSPKFGWFTYSLSKVSLRFLIESYALEFKNYHFINYNPGLIDTKMQKKIRQLDDKKFPSIKIFKDNFRKKLIPSPDKSAKQFFKSLKLLRKLNSGSYFDIRK